jgi:hypothetical protein
LEGKIPGRIHNIGKFGLGDWDMPASNPGRINVMREEFHVDSVGFVCEKLSISST